MGIKLELGTSVGIELGLPLAFDGTVVGLEVELGFDEGRGDWDGMDDGNMVDVGGFEGVISVGNELGISLGLRLGASEDRTTVAEIISHCTFC